MLSLTHTRPSSSLWSTNDRFILPPFLGLFDSPPPHLDASHVLALGGSSRSGWVPPWPGGERDRQGDSRHLSPSGPGCGRGGGPSPQGRGSGSIGRSGSNE
eukprot:scaffold373_cov350-Pavlova_lutheri.AAC.24